MRKSAVVLFILILSCGLRAGAVTNPFSSKPDPSFRWTTIETPHFLIHHHQGGEELAERAARIAEAEHARLVPRIKWSPRDKTHLIFVDAADFAMGATATFPYNRILFLVNSAGFPGDWLKAVITHEYTHLLQLDMVAGLPRSLQKIFGRIYFPNDFQPIWMIEGLAEYERFEAESGGQYLTYDMMVRMAVLEKALPSLGRISTYSLDSWPGSSAPYVFGESFERFLVDRFGRDAVARISTIYSGRAFPFLVDSTGKRVLSRSYEDLWGQWRDSLEERYEKKREKIEARGLTASVPMTTRGSVNSHPAFSPDGARIAYTVTNADSFPGIHVMNADGSGDRKLVDTNYAGGAISWSPDGGRIYYAKLETWRNNNYYNDLYYFDLDKNKEVRLTRGLRARDPHPDPEGKKIVFVVDSLDRTRLATLDVSGDGVPPGDDGAVTFLTEWSRNLYLTPRFDPYGGQIATGVHLPDGAMDIWILDARGNKLEEVTRDRAPDGAPSWSPDGKRLYFSSYRTGISNLYAYETGTKEILQVTNVIGGAFAPDLSPDGKTIVFSSYSSRGYDLQALTVDPDQWQPASPGLDTDPPVLYEDQPVETFSRPYSPISTILPRYWFPYFESNTESGFFWGLSTSGEDALRQHRYSANLLYGARNDRFAYSLDYFYEGFYPTLHLQAFDTDRTYGRLLSDDTGTHDYLERRRSCDLSVIVPFLKTGTQHSLRLGYRWQKNTALTTVPPWPEYGGLVPSEGVLTSGHAGYSFNNTRRVGFSISPEMGRKIELGYQRTDKALGGDFEFDKYTGDWQEFINLPWKHHVLVARAFAGTSVGEATPQAQNVFQLGGDSPGDQAFSIDSTGVHLRGYAPNEFRGSRIGLVSLEYRFPILNQERGYGSKPLFLERMHGAVFGEAGNAWEGDFHGPDLKRSVGAEVRFDVTVGYWLPLTVRIGLARGLDEQGRTMLIGGFRTAF